MAAVAKALPLTHAVALLRYGFVDPAAKDSTTSGECTA